MVFLRWSTQSAPASLALEDVWENAGPPSTLGYLVFLQKVPVIDAPALEQDLRDLLPAPDDTGFVWVVYTPGTEPATDVQTLLAITPDEDDIPCVEGDTELNTLPGHPRVGFYDQSPVIAAYRDECIVSFSITYPPIEGAEPPRGPGPTLPMTGEFIGCLTFNGLVDKLGAPEKPSVALKTRVVVSIDPLRPLDTTRNRMTFTDQDYYLTEDSGVYRLSVAP